MEEEPLTILGFPVVMVDKEEKILDSPHSIVLGDFSAYIVKIPAVNKKEKRLTKILLKEKAPVAKIVWLLWYSAMRKERRKFWQEWEQKILYGDENGRR